MAKLLVWLRATDHPQARAWESNVHMSVTSWVRGGWEKGTPSLLDWVILLLEGSRNQFQTSKEAPRRGPNQS